MPITFGQNDRYYALDQTANLRAHSTPLTEKERQFARFLEHYNPGLRDQVERAFKQWNGVLRGYLREETALKLTVGDEMQAVPVRVKGGLPTPFADVLGSFDEWTWSLLLNRGLLESSAKGLVFIREVFDWISEWEPISPCPATSEEVLDTGTLVDRLLKEVQELKILEQIKNIRQDILGAYFFRLPEIHLYWMVIGFFAGMLGVSADALTVAVATHELAHAYTHLGKDLDGGRWDTETFAQTDDFIVEGLAQFYADVICKKLEFRFPAASAAYEALLRIQSGPYQIHKEWLKDADTAGEVIRYSMVECRSKQTKDRTNFESIRKRHAQELSRAPQGNLPL